MRLKDIIIKILERGGKFKAKEIAIKASILDDVPYSSDDIIEIIFKELNNIVKYDKLTYKYFMYENKEKTSPQLSNSELIIQTLKTNNLPMTSIDISNFIKIKYNKTLKFEEILFIILTELKNEISNTNDRNVKFYLKNNFVKKLPDIDVKENYKSNINNISQDKNLINMIKDGSRISAFFYFKQNSNIKNNTKLNESFNLLWDRYHN